MLFFLGDPERLSQHLDIGASQSDLDSIIVDLLGDAVVDLLGDFEQARCCCERFGEFQKLGVQHHPAGMLLVVVGFDEGRAAFDLADSLSISIVDTVSVESKWCGSVHS